MAKITVYIDGQPAPSTDVEVNGMTVTFHANTTNESKTYNVHYDNEAEPHYTADKEITVPKCEESLSAFTASFVFPQGKECVSFTVTGVTDNGKTILGNVQGYVITGESKNNFGEYVEPIIESDNSTNWNVNISRLGNTASYQIVISYQGNVYQNPSTDKCHFVIRSGIQSIDNKLEFDAQYCKLEPTVEVKAYGSDWTPLNLISKHEKIAYIKPRLYLKNNNHTYYITIDTTLGLTAGLITKTEAVQGSGDWYLLSSKKPEEFKECECGIIRVADQDYSKWTCPNLYKIFLKKDTIYNGQPLSDDDLNGCAIVYANYDKNNKKSTNNYYVAELPKYKCDGSTVCYSVKDKYGFTSFRFTEFIMQYGKIETGKFIINFGPATD